MAQMTRTCEECPEWTRTVCRHAFGRFWDVKSRDGEGCDHPLDGVAEAWRARGWTPGTGTAIPVSLPLPPAAPPLPRRPPAPQRAPVRPKPPAPRQAGLFAWRGGR